MTAGTIFVLCLTGAFVMFILYLTRLSRRTLKEEEEAKALETAPRPGNVDSKPPLKRVG